ncbi:unnamed protein product, partial [Symbiodinium sp. KB8]
VTGESLEEGQQGRDDVVLHSKLTPHEAAAAAAIKRHLAEEGLTAEERAEAALLAEQRAQAMAEAGGGSSAAFRESMERGAAQASVSADAAVQWGQSMLTASQQAVAGEL